MQHNKTKHNTTETSYFEVYIPEKAPFRIYNLDFYFDEYFGVHYFEARPLLSQ